MRKDKIKFYKVGGCVRDKLMGVESKDIDYTVVFEDAHDLTPEVAFQLLEMHLKQEGFTVYLSTPEMFTIRAKWPDGEDADFVLARREISYDSSSRKPDVILGTLGDDLLRRDFTVNAIAEDEDGNLVDPFGGAHDLLERKILRTPLPAKMTMLDDPLRVLRALRFSITKGLGIDKDIWFAMNQNGLLSKLNKTVSSERIREELSKMFAHDTAESIKMLTTVEKEFIPGFLDVIFKDGLWLMPTMKKK